MSPVYQKDNGWHFRLFGREFGPYKSEADAWDMYESLLTSGDCPTCEE